MKKLYTLGLFMAAGLTFAQTNLLQNSGFETWADGVPASYSPYTGPNGSPSINNFVAQETGIKHSGESSLRHQSQSSTQIIEHDLLIPVVSGHRYTVSYWYLDNDTAARTRIWSSWIQQVDTQYNSMTNDAATLRPETNDSYSTENAQWINKVVEVTAPTGATHFRYQVRTYRQTTGVDGGYIYYDDFSFVDNDATAGVKNNEIAGLKMYPNPLNGSVLNIASNSNAAKTVAIYDVLGKQVVNTTTANGTLNVAHLNAGVYVVKISEEGKVATRKLVKQ